MSFLKIFYFAATIISAFVLSLLLFQQISQIACDESKTIETGVGAVRGVKETTFWKRVDYYSFKGIPYAEKPIGKLRFKVNIPFFHLIQIAVHKRFCVQFRHQNQWNHGSQRF